MGVADLPDEEALPAILRTAGSAALSGPVGGERYGSYDSGGHFYEGLT